MICIAAENLGRLGAVNRPVANMVMSVDLHVVAARIRLCISSPRGVCFKLGGLHGSVVSLFQERLGLARRCKASNHTGDWLHNQQTKKCQQLHGVFVRVSRRGSDTALSRVLAGSVLRGRPVLVNPPDGRPEFEDLGHLAKIVRCSA